MEIILSGQLWEPCPICDREPVYLSLGGYCEKCGKQEQHISTECYEPYRRGIGQGFGDGEDGE